MPRRAATRPSSSRSCRWRRPRAFEPDVGLWKATVGTKSGKQEIAARTSPFGTPTAITIGGKTHHHDGFTLSFAEREDAQRAATLLSRAIRACGGKPRTAATARARANDAEAQASTDRLLRRTLPPRARAEALSACHSRVRERLKVPGGARFVGEPRVTVSGDSTMLALGTVEGQNALGGYQSLSYACTFEKFGKQYVPKSVLLTPRTP